jgi:hypothetical protein
MIHDGIINEKICKKTKRSPTRLLLALIFMDCMIAINAESIVNIKYIISFYYIGKIVSFRLHLHVIFNDLAKILHSVYKVRRYNNTRAEDCFIY